MKYTYKLSPCSSYDIEGMESWLSDLALEGLMLTENGFFFGFGCFERSEPRQMRYRLTAADSIPSRFTLNDVDLPSDEAIGISEDMDWEFVCRRGGFYIYRTASPSAPELNSDPQILALTLQQLKKHQRSDLIGCLISVALYLALFLLPNRSFVLSWIAMGTPFCLLTILLVLAAICRRALDMLHINQLRRKLLSDGSLDHHKDYRAGRGRYLVSKSLNMLLCLLWIIALVNTVGAHLTESGKVILADYEGTIPFATVQDYVEGDYIESPIFVPNSVQVWHDTLFPVNYDYHEQASITRNDEIFWEVNYYVDYHETAFPWLARLLAEDYLRYNRDDEYTILPLPELDVDYACAFIDHGIRVVLQKDCVVVHAYFSQYSEYELAPEEWVAILAESIG